MTKKEKAAAASEAAAALSRARWAKPEWKDSKTRSAYMKRVQTFRQNNRGGRPRAADRCPCGANTRKRALSRKFDCCRKAGVAIPAVG
jgi:hypothetical protein